MILITGGAGLLGTVLIQSLLDQGLQVRAIFNQAKPNIQHPSLELVQADILDVFALEDAMKGIDQVYHCAGLVSFLPEDVRRLYKINVEGTSNLVNAAVDAGVKKFIHVSSVAALGRIRKGQLITESMNWTKETSNSTYGHSKYLGELEVWRGVAEGLEAVVVNPVIIIGPGNWETGSTRIFKSAYEEFPWYTEGSTGFVDVRDVSDAMIALMNSNISGERFIISGGNHSYRYIFEQAAGYFNKKPPYKKVAPLLASILWRVEALKAFFTGKPPLVTRETTLTAMTKVNYDNSKLLKALPGFQYRGIDTTIEYTCQALQQKLNKQ